MLEPVPPVDYGKWRLFFEVFLFIWNGGVSAYLWLSRSQHVTRTRIEGLERTMGTRSSVIENRLTAIEGDLKHLPTDDDIAEIYRVQRDSQTALTNLVAKVSELQGEISAIRPGLQMIHQFLLERKGP